MFTTNLFQFHKGTIRTVNVADSDAQNLYFNSIKVRLEPNVAHQGYDRAIISIP